MNDILNVLKRFDDRKIRGENVRSTAKKWHESGFTAEEVEQLILAGVYKPDNAMRLRDIGVSPNDLFMPFYAGEYLHSNLISERFLNGSITADEMKRVIEQWRNNRFPVPWKLTVDPLPRSLWGKSLHKILPPNWWNWFRDQSRKKYPNDCGICGRSSTVYEFHEVWSYQFDEQVAYISDIIPLCEMCHAVKHWGRSERIPELRPRIFPHWRDVNGLAKSEDWAVIRLHARYMQEVISRYRKMDAVTWSPQKEIVELMEIKKKRALMNERERVRELVESIARQLNYETDSIPV